MASRMRDFGAPVGNIFTHKELLVVNLGYNFDPKENAPYVNRMDCVHRTTLAFLFDASEGRANDIVRFFFKDGMLTIDYRIRGSFPEGKSAPWAKPFIQALRELHRGVSFLPYDEMDGFFNTSKCFMDTERLHLVCDASGLSLRGRFSASASALHKCPTSSCYIIGGPKGFCPLSADGVLAFLHANHINFAFKASIGSVVQFCSSIAAYLQVRNDACELRNDCAFFVV
eukprot:GEMP01034921.1.p1 GENE.GEMP01034921.1~~GEMP01034921.1.p1  ORF type:complete len:228 (+),score=8.60 GEMP01034921.1:106-789(+)